jgi:hypothetical protein
LLAETAAAGQGWPLFRGVHPLDQLCRAQESDVVVDLRRCPSGVHARTWTNRSAGLRYWFASNRTLPVPPRVIGSTPARTDDVAGRLFS